MDNVNSACCLCTQTDRFASLVYKAASYAQAPLLATLFDSSGCQSDEQILQSNNLNCGTIPVPDDSHQTVCRWILNQLIDAIHTIRTIHILLPFLTLLPLSKSLVINHKGTTSDSVEKVLQTNWMFIQDNFATSKHQTVTWSICLMIDQETSLRLRQTDLPHVIIT